MRLRAKSREVVRAIEARPELPRRAVGFGVDTRQTEQGAPHADLALGRPPRGDRAHAAEPGEACPARQVEQHRLGLIVGGVGHEHGTRAAAMRDPREEVVAGKPARLLQRAPRLLGQRGHVDAFDVEGDAEPLAEAGHIGRVGAALFTAQAVVEVGSARLDAGLVLQRRHGVEEADGIGAAGDANERASRYRRARRARERTPARRGGRGGRGRPLASSRPPPSSVAGALAAALRWWREHDP